MPKTSQLVPLNALTAILTTPCVSSSARLAVAGLALPTNFLRVPRISFALRMNSIVHGSAMTLPVATLQIAKPLKSAKIPFVQLPSAFYPLIVRTARSAKKTNA